MSVDMIELDVRMSKDNGLYLMHDRSTARTADQGIIIEDATAEEIARIRLKNGEPVPRLDDVLSMVSGACALNLEVKSFGAGAIIAEHLRTSGYGGTVLLSSFEDEELDAARQILPELSVAVIFDVFKPRNIEAYRELGFSVISLRKRTVNEKLISACHEQGVRVYAWTIDDENEMIQFIRWGVDGIFSNKPDILQAAIQKIQKA